MEADDRKFPSNTDSKKLVNELVSWFKTIDADYYWRKEQVSDYVKVLAEIFLQQTNRKSVEKILPRFLEKFSNWKSIKASSMEELKSEIEPLGLWRKRSKTLKTLAEKMVERKGELPRKREKIEALPGVGQYIANAIELFVHGKPRPLLDVNMARVLERYFGERELADIRDDPYLQEISQRVVEQGDPEKINFAILDLAGMICTKNSPKCDKCPLRANCRYYNEHQD